jgi:hypothetical protein
MTLVEIQVEASGLIIWEMHEKIALYSNKEWVYSGE